MKKGRKEERKKGRKKGSKGNVVEKWREDKDINEWPGSPLPYDEADVL